MNQKKTLMKRNTPWEGRCLQLVPLGQVSACTHFPANTSAFRTGTFYCCYFIYFWQRSQIQIYGTLGLQWTYLLWIYVLVLTGIKLVVVRNCRGVELYNTSNMTIEGRKVPCFNLFMGSPQERNSLLPLVGITTFLCPPMSDLLPNRGEKSYVLYSPWLPNTLVQFPQKLL